MLRGRQSGNEIESGKAVYGALQQNDYDEAAKQYLMLVAKKAEDGDFKEAMQQAKRFLDRPRFFFIGFLKTCNIISDILYYVNKILIIRFYNPD